MFDKSCAAFSVPVNAINDITHWMPNGNTEAGSQFNRGLKMDEKVLHFEHLKFRYFLTIGSLHEFGFELLKIFGGLRITQFTPVYVV